MFERFTERARRVVVLAQEESRMLGHNHIGSEHLLLGLIHEQSGPAGHVLGSAGVTLENARPQVAELASRGSKSPMGHVPFTQRAKRILELSLREALEQNKSYIGPEHILLGLIRDADGAGAQILERLGGPLSALRQRVIEAAGAAAPESTAEEEGLGLRPTAWSRAQPQAISDARLLLTPINRRLANIERHLGIATDTTDTAGREPIPGFRGMLVTIARRVANIERHLGITARQETAGDADAGEVTGDEAAGDADAAPGDDGPEATAGE
jgi:ATP-dependent Clp protease ATP-binding subunit ClpA